MTTPFREVAALIAQEPTLGEDGDGISAAMRRLCRAAVSAVKASGVGLTVMTSVGARGMTVASDQETERLEELALTTGEGPTVDAFVRRRPVLVADLSDGAMTRWPGYAPVLYASGIRAIFAFPLQVGAAQLGVLDIMRPDVGSLSTTDVTLALTFAEVAVSMLLDAQQLASAGGEVDGLSEGLAARPDLFQAQGMVMVQLGGSLSDAMAAIRAYAFSHDRRIGDVAADIVARRITFDPEQA